MGSFSWTRADRATDKSNIIYNDRYKLLIPEEFGGGFIEDIYKDYGIFQGCADLYGILAYWNDCKGLEYDGRKKPRTMDEILKKGHTANDNNREKGIDIGCYDYQVDALKYPLKLVSIEYCGSYEECKGRSYSDPEQGFERTTWEETDKRSKKYGANYPFKGANDRD